MLNVSNLFLGVPDFSRVGYFLEELARDVGYGHCRYTLDCHHKAFCSVYASYISLGSFEYPVRDPYLVAFVDRQLYGLYMTGPRARYEHKYLHRPVVNLCRFRAARMTVGDSSVCRPALYVGKLLECRADEHQPRNYRLLAICDAVTAETFGKPHRDIILDTVLFADFGYRCNEIAIDP